MAKPGDRVKVKTKEKDFEGILMPAEHSDAVIIKLSSGASSFSSSHRIRSNSRLVIRHSKIEY